MDKKVRVYLILILILVGAVPFASSFYIVRGLLSYHEELNQTLDLNRLADDYSQTLKDLSKHNPSNKYEYRQRFDELQNQKLLFEEREGLVSKVNSTLTRVYLLIFGSLVMVFFFLGSFLSNRIAKIYNKTYLELQGKKERTRYLSQFERISEIVKNINHEMKKPLAPIETWNQNLLSAYQRKETDFEQTLVTSNKIISEEVKTLKNIVNSFNKYTALPEPQMERVNLVSFLLNLKVKFAEVYEVLDLSLAVGNQDQLFVEMDPRLISQVFQNLIENAIEANPNQNVKCFISIAVSRSEVFVEFENKGKEISHIDKIFDPQFTTKDTEDSGFGLSISRVSLLKHGGDLTAVPICGGAKFLVKLSISKEL